MFDGGHHHVALLRLRNESAMEGGVVTLGAATGENDFPRLRIDQGGDLRARLIDVAGQFASKSISARGISPMLLQEGQHRLEDLRRNARRGVVVEVNDRRLIHWVKPTHNTEWARLEGSPSRGHGLGSAGSVALPDRIDLTAHW